MDKFVSKLSLYDILAMVIPGGTILLFLSLCLGYQNFCIHESKFPQWLSFTVICIASYLIGLVNHIITSFFWGDFSKNSFYMDVHIAHLICQQKKLCIASKWLRKNYKNVRTIIPLLYVIVILVFAICNIVPCLNTLRNFSSPWIVSMCVFMAVFFILACAKHFKSLQNLRIQNKCAQYYYVLKNRYSDDIPIIEGQIAFIQNMMFPLSLFYLLSNEKLYYYFGKESLGWIYMLYTLFYLMLPFVVICRQLKINQRLQEDYHYLKELENEKSNNV